MVQPAFIGFERSGREETRLGCVVAAIEADYADDDGAFTWRGRDEIEEASGDGFAEHEPDGTIAGQMIFGSGDTASPITHSSGFFRSLLARDAPESGYIPVADARNAAGRLPHRSRIP